MSLWGELDDLKDQSKDLASEIDEIVRGLELVEQDDDSSDMFESITVAINRMEDLRSEIY